ncbi:DnaD domain-containing protein [Halobacillus mangrovi]|uniref:DnaB/C C-terminal domain-containing protein n=1 Tax=Halobacillus mangrovi TaxID=402384 RepID=A0A1W5ZQU5_9BACI|nr:DnaD domain protein [Halobacillus mangrovi]ARI75659.1 hypothetical protein HM131_01935 [Halobacillus mangrovi]
MNYLKENIAFFDQIELDSLSSSAVVLWYTLLQYNNKARWKKEFSVPASAILLKSGLTESSFKRARQELKEKGYIKHRSIHRNHAPFYQMNSLVDVQTNRQVDQDPGHQTDQQVNWQTIESKAPQTVALFKPNQIKEKETVGVVDTLNAHTFYEQNLGMLNPLIAEKITEWCEDLSEDIVIESMKIALMHNKPFFQYCEGVLKRWKNQNVRSIQDVNALEVQNRKKQQPTKSSDADQIFAEIRKEREA